MNTKAIEEEWVEAGEESVVINLQEERLKVPNFASFEETMAYMFVEIDGVLHDRMFGNALSEEEKKSAIEHVKWIVDCEQWRLMLDANDTAEISKPGPGRAAEISAQAERQMDKMSHQDNGANIPVEAKTLATPDKAQRHDDRKSTRSLGGGKCVHTGEPLANPAVLALPNFWSVWREYCSIMNYSTQEGKHGPN